jgi:hypothetical protein
MWKRATEERLIQNIECSKYDTEKNLELCMAQYTRPYIEMSSASEKLNTSPPLIDALTIRKTELKVYFVWILNRIHFQSIQIPLLISFHITS